MKVLSEAAPFGAPPAPVSLALGVFDGVHLGHQEVLDHTVREARREGGVAVAVTFDRHPSITLAPERAPLLIWPVWRRLRAFEALGFEAALVLAFDLEFSRQSARDFVQRLTHGFGRVSTISVGTTFRFGYGRSGDLAVLRRMGEALGFLVHGIAPLERLGDTVSSTRVRESIASGDLERAAELLGRPWTLAGAVVEGDRLGRQLGFPTANLDATGLVLPPHGVYAATVVVDTRRYPAAVNIGRRPTVAAGVGATRVEAHLLGFEGDLYGARVELELDHRIRGEQRFPSREALTARIGEDVEAVRSWGGKRGLPCLRPNL